MRRLVWNFIKNKKNAAGKNRLEALFAYERRIKTCYTYIAGVDEAGRVPLAAGNCGGYIAGRGTAFGLKRFEKLSPQKREELYREIGTSIDWAVGYASVNEITAIIYCRQQNWR